MLRRSAGFSGSRFTGRRLRIAREGGRCGTVNRKESVSDTTTYETLIAEARAKGADHGRAAASWYFDGNTDEGTYVAVLRGIEDGDPEILDTFPLSPLSGEWADEPTPASVLEELGVPEDDGSGKDDTLRDEILGAYEDGFYEASADEIERVARLQTA